MKNHLRSLVAALAAAVSFTGFGGTMYYVSPTGDGTDPTAGFATGYSTLKAALDAAPAESTILLDRATFSFAADVANEVTKLYTISKKLTISGVGKPEETVLDGGVEVNRRNSGQNGHNPSFKLNAAGIVLKNLTFDRMGSRCDIALDVQQKECLVTNVIFRNHGHGYTDPITAKSFINLSWGVLSACVFTNNVFGGNLVAVSYGQVENCYIASNKCTGAGQNVTNPGILALNGGVYPGTKNRNNTIVGNLSAATAVTHKSSNALFVNNIVWGNRSLDGTEVRNYNVAEDYLVKWSYNCVEGDAVFTGAGNVYENPQFEADGFHLKSSSPCKWTADPTCAPTVDIEGSVRPGSPSRGCVEVTAGSGSEFDVEVDGSALVVPSDGTITLSAVVKGIYSSPCTYAWDLDGDGKVDSRDENPVLSDVGRYDKVSVTVTDATQVSVTQTSARKFVIAPESGVTVYVSPAGDATDPTAGVATGYRTVKAALDAVPAGSTVLLDRATFSFAQGVENEINTIYSIGKKLTISGLGNPDETVLDGGREWNRRGSGQDKHYPGFKLNAEGVLLKNMTFERMGSRTDMMIDIQQAKCVVSNIVIRNTGFGYTEPLTAKTLVNLDKGGILSACVITNNVFGGNAVLVANGQVENCYIARNRCTGECSNSKGILLLNGGVYPGTKNRNNTIVSNQTVAAYAAVRHTSSNALFVNNIVWGNVSLDGAETLNYEVSSGCLGKWSCNCVEGDSVFTGAGNIYVDPLFEDDCIHLKATSLCRGAADPLAAPRADLEGTERAEKPTIGCVECTGELSFTCEIEVSGETVVEPATVELSVKISGNPKEPLSYAWDFDGDGVIDSREEKPVLSAVKGYNPSVTVKDADGNEAANAYPSIVIVYSKEKVFYVTPGPNPKAKPPYASWETAAITLKDVYDHASLFAGSTIVFDDGAFDVGEFVCNVDNGMKITSRNGRDFTTIDSTARRQTYVYFKVADAASIVEGLTITYPKGEAWVKGLAAVVTAGTVRDCAIIGILNNSCVVQLNGTASAPARMERCIVAGNRTKPNGAMGIEMLGTSILENCLVADNVNTNKTQGSALFCNSTAAVIRNCTFCNNECRANFPLYFSFQPAVFENNVVFGNTTNDYASAANDLHYYSYLVLQDGMMPNARRCCVYPATGDYSGNERILTVDPKFVDGATGDFHLTDNSPCVNAGDKTAYGEGAFDLDGNPRVCRKKVDLGCYENQKLRGLQILVR